MPKTLASLLLLFALPLFGAQPRIAHDPPASVASHQSLKIVAKVTAPGETISKVTLHIAQSSGVAPADIAMQSAGAGIYYGTISVRQFAGASSFKYYIDAHTASGEWSETPWATVKVIGGSAAASTRSGEESNISRPLIIIGGGAAAVAAAIALSDSGGGGGGDNEAPDDTNPGDVADQVIVRSSSDSVNSPTPSLPDTTIIDAGAELAGRTINRVRIRLEFDGVDDAEDAYEVAYAGSTVFSGATGTTRTQQVDVVGTDDTTVEIRILTSLPGENGNSQYSWNATVTYFLEP